jgi:phosphoserine phosphatase
MSSADSSGLSIPKAEIALIFDLDGTLLTVNSFHYWVRSLLFGRFGGLSRRERTVLSLRTAWALIERKALGKGRAGMKRYLQALWADALEKDKGKIALHDLEECLKNRVRANMGAVLALVGEGRFDAVLATAAAGEYVESFARRLGFTHILATDALGENSGARKRDRVLALLAEQGLHTRRRIFFTDHVEDLPFIRESQLILWFGKEEQAQEIRESAPDAQIISCLGLSGAEIVKLLC